MNRTLFRATLILSILIGHCTNKQPPRNIEGDWYYVLEKDSTYGELYFDQGLFVYNIRSIGISGANPYYLQQDSLFAIENPSVPGEFILRLIGKEDNGFQTVVFPNGDTVLLERFHSNDPFYYYLSLTEPFKIELTKNMLERSVKVLDKRGYAKPRNEEAIIDSYQELIDTTDHK